MSGPVPAQRRRAARAELGPDAVDAYLTRAVRGDGQTAVRLALDLVDNGVPTGDVIDGLLGPAQRAAGDRWLANDWTAAEEHLVSGVSQKALDAVAATIEPPAADGLIVVVCAEGDWHSLPAQMFAEMLRGHGFAVAFLGGSTPADHVAAYLSRQRADAVAVSCNLAPFFGGVTRLADAAHARGIPVLAGGPALGRGQRRAVRLGADAWAPGIDGAVAVLSGWRRRRPRVPAEPTSFAAAAAQVDSSAADIAGIALGALVAGYRPMAELDDGQLGRVRENLADVTRFTAAARLADDPSVLSEMLRWLRTFLLSRRLPAIALNAGLCALAPVIGRIDPGASRLVLDAIPGEPAFVTPAESG